VNARVGCFPVDHNGKQEILTGAGLCIAQSKIDGILVSQNIAKIA
jgi:hypothetical protein